MERVEHIHAEMDALPTVDALIKMLSAEAPSSRLLTALREARRFAHPACEDIKNNLALHQAHAASRNYTLKLPENVPAAPAGAPVEQRAPAPVHPGLHDILMSIVDRLGKLEAATPAAEPAKATKESAPTGG